MKPLVFLGSNYNLRQMVDICELRGITVSGVVDADYYGNKPDICGIPVIGSEESFPLTDNYVYFNAVNINPTQTGYSGRNYQKHAKISNLISQLSLECVNLVHPSAIVPATVTLGTNIMIGAHAVLGNNTNIGNYCQVREQSYLAHNAVLHDNAVMQVQSYVGASIEVMDFCYIAVKATVISRNGANGVLPHSTFVKTAERYLI